MKKFLLPFILIAAFLLQSCDNGSIWDNLNTLPNKFKNLSEYTLLDFRLNGDFTYWEVRKRIESNNFSIPDTILTVFSFDKSAYKR